MIGIPLVGLDVTETGVVPRLRNYLPNKAHAI